MANEEQRGIDVAWTVVMAIFLVIIMRAALENFFPPLLLNRGLHELWKAWPPEGRTILRTGQLVVFFILLARFYGGAYRYNNEHRQGPHVSTVTGKIINLVGTFLLFLLFYITATNVWTLDLFYVLILLIHLLDSAWFGYSITRLKNSPLGYIAGCFLAWNFLTLVLSAAAVAFLWGNFWYDGGIVLQIVLLSIILSVSLVDWIVLRQFYFKPEEWRKGEEGKK